MSQSMSEQAIVDLVKAAIENGAIVANDGHGGAKTQVLVDEAALALMASDLQPSLALRASCLKISALAGELLRRQTEVLHRPALRHAGTQRDFHKHVTAALRAAQALGPLAAHDGAVRSQEAAEERQAVLAAVPAEDAFLQRFEKPEGKTGSAEEVTDERIAEIEVDTASASSIEIHKLAARLRDHRGDMALLRGNLESTQRRVDALQRFPKRLLDALEEMANRDCLDLDDWLEEDGKAWKDDAEAANSALISQSTEVRSASATPDPDAEMIADRLHLLATRVRETYGRAVLRSCGLDDVEERGIVLADCEPGEFEPGTRLPPVRSLIERLAEPGEAERLLELGTGGYVTREDVEAKSRELQEKLEKSDGYRDALSEVAALGGPGSGIAMQALGITEKPGHITPVADALRAGDLPGSLGGTRWRHVKTLGEYVFWSWAIDAVRQRYVAIYQEAGKSAYYVRDAEQFLDGRFERIVKEGE